jgi:hypothetical protein
MKKRILFCVFAFLASLSSVFFVATPTYAEDLCKGSKAGALGITRWCEGLTDTEIQNWKTGGRTAIAGTIKKVALNIGAMIAEVGAYIAVALVMYGGFLYMTSSGDPGKAASGRKTITNAVIGIIITRVADLIMKTIRDVGGLVNGTSASGVAKDLANEFLFWGGAICVIMILWGALQYTTAAGDPGKAAKARQTIVYSGVGLVIMLVAGAIVNFAITTIR